MNGPLFGSKRHCRAGRGGDPQGTEEPGSAARPALQGSLTRLTRSDSRQLTDTPMAIRAAKAPTSQTRTGTFFSLLMTTSFYNRGRRCPGADACHRFMNQRARMVTRETPPAGLTRAGGGLIRLGRRRSSGNSALGAVIGDRDTAAIGVLRRRHAPRFRRLRKGANGPALARAGFGGATGGAPPFARTAHRIEALQGRINGCLAGAESARRFDGGMKQV